MEEDVVEAQKGKRITRRRLPFCAWFAASKTLKDLVVHTAVKVTVVAGKVKISMTAKIK